MDLFILSNKDINHKLNKIIYSSFNTYVLCTAGLKNDPLRPKLFCQFKNVIIPSCVNGICLIRVLYLTQWDGSSKLIICQIILSSVLKTVHITATGKMETPLEVMAFRNFSAARCSVYKSGQC